VGNVMFKGGGEFLYSYLVAYRNHIIGKQDILRVLDSLSGQFRQMSPSELRQMTCSRIRYSPWTL